MKSRDVDRYIASFPREVQARLRQVRRTIRAAAPKADEILSYRMPAYRQRGVLVYFAGFRNHIGLYPPVRGSETLQKAVAKYAGPKGNLKFPFDEPLPLALIGRIVRFKAKQDLTKAGPPRKKSRQKKNEVKGR